MKFIQFSICIILASTTATLIAQPPPKDFNRPGAGAPERRQWRPDGPESASPVQRWLQELQASDPETHDKLQQLRMEDPEAFRMEARKALSQRVLSNIQRERPSVYSALQELTEEDREWIMSRIARMPHMMHRQSDQSTSDERDSPDERDQNRRLIRQYHNATDTGEKAGIRETLRTNLSAQYDRRIQEREEQLREATVKLEKIRQALAQGHEGKEAFIEEKLSIWLNADGPPRREGKGRFRPGSPEDN